jgi:sugar (glycoside-pentoside-hexuronide) transporter
LAAAPELAKATETLPTRVKAIYALGDHTVNLGLSALLFLFPAFLTDVAMLRPAFAGLVPLIARGLDAFADPAMGRLSDATRWRHGRRRPYFLIGALPLGASFAALWFVPEGAGENVRFAWYAAVYVVFALSTTVVSVPYLALIPEMTSSYQERTSVNSWRAAGAILGTLLAVAGMGTLARALGGDARAWWIAGCVAGLWIAAPWPLVYRATFERSDFQRPAHEPFFTSLLSLARHPAYVRLTGLFLLGRIAIDLTSTMLLYYFTYWLRREEDFYLAIGLFLFMIVVALPFWLWISHRVEKSTVYVLGALSWIGSQAFLFLATPDWPRFWIFLGCAIGGIGYAAADMSPWSMLGEVVDEDELRSGERREGLYFGLFTFLRKLGGAAAVALALFAFDLAGYVPNAPQSEQALTALRVLTAVVPGVFVALGGWVALSYPLTRARHAEILVQLERRRAAGAAP